MLAAGDEVAGCFVDALVGSGSSADVYRVHRVDAQSPDPSAPNPSAPNPSAPDPTGPDPTPPGPIALKILHADAAAPERTRERFAREFDIASKLHHRNIVEVYDRGELTVFTSQQADATPGTRSRAVHTLWMTMQYIDGTAATSLIPDRRTEPDVAQVIRTGLDIADALDYAHANDVIHRDVKPANIMVTGPPTGSAYLTDFGIAQLLDDARPLARNGRVLGSIAYASPELLQAQQLTQKTDLYAFACTLCELLTGAPPFTGPTPFAITYAHIHSAPPRLSRRRPWLPTSLDAVFAKALAKKPADRYDSCTQFMEIVDRTLRDVPVPEPDRRRRLRWPGGH